MQSRSVLPRLFSSPRAPCFGLMIGAAVGLFYGGCDRSGWAAETAGAAEDGPVKIEATTAPPSPNPEPRAEPDPAALPAPSEAMATSEPLLDDVSLHDASVELAESAGSLPRSPITPDQAGAHLRHAWKAVTGTALSDAGLAVLLSHWALETGRGEKMVGFNFGGLKGESPGGGSVSIWTRERRDDELTLVRRRFRAYPDATAGARDYVKLLRQRYPRARRAVERGSVVDFVLGLEEGGYFTDEPGRYLRAMRSLSREFQEGATEASI